MTADTLFDRQWSCLNLSRAGPVATVALHRPDARNSLNGALMGELTEVASLLRRRHDVLAVILTGSEAYFSAGADLAALPVNAPAASLLEKRRSVMAGPDMCRAWEEIEAVTIVAIEGYCIGGACALAVACDFRIMGEGGYFRLPEVPLGISMSWRSIPRIIALIGPARAKRFVMFGEATSAETCRDWGFVDELAPAGGALVAARLWAGKVASLPPLPVRMTKEAVNANALASAHAGIYMDRDQYLLTASTEDFREGVGAFFQRRPGEFSGN